MSKVNPMKFSSEWLEDEKFKELLHEYIVKDAYNPNQDENLRIFVTYQTLYRLYTTTLNTKENVLKLDDDLANLDETVDDVKKSLNTSSEFIVKQEKINKAILLEVRIFFILIILLELVLICNTSNIFK